MQIHLMYPRSLILPCSANLACNNSTSLNAMMGGTRSSLGVTTDVSRTNGRAVSGVAFVRIVRVESIWGLENSSTGVDFEEGSGIGDPSSGTRDWPGCITAFGGYRETNARSNTRAASRSPDLSNVRYDAKGLRYDLQCEDPSHGSVRPFD